ncbi:MAG: bifunctional hydroxymethylpyrimidine kinase/phosphomethylpyrimidine kinase [Kiritimatiellia bacterium]
MNRGKVKTDNRPVVLTVAGSDSGGGAGIQADLGTFGALGAFGTTAVTCVTAQNPSEVRGVFPVDPGAVTLQIGTVCDYFPVAAAKTGMLYSADIVRAAARALRENGVKNLVVDPVMLATSGARLIEEEAVEVMCEELFSAASVITPNAAEAAALSGVEAKSRSGQERAARRLHEKFHTACVVKGGHTAAEKDGSIADVLFDGCETVVFKHELVESAGTHGTGCTFSAATAALLARGKTLREAVKGAGEFVVNGLKNPLSG